MKYLIAIVLVFAFTVQSAFAEDIVHVKKGDAAPYDGYLLDQEKANKVRDQALDNEGLVKTNESLNKSIILYKSNQDLLTQENDILLKKDIELTKTLNDTRTTSDWVKVGYFVLGVVVVSAGVYGASHLSR